MRVSSDRRRHIEIDGPPLDANAIMRGSAAEHETPVEPEAASGPSVVWEGLVAGDGTGPQKSYFVRLYADSTATCQCPAFYFRGTLRRDPNYACKHIARARQRASDQS